MAEFLEDDDIAWSIKHREIALDRLNRRATKSNGNQGRFIEAGGPYFYLNTFPCRPVKPGEVWDIPGKANSLFIGAQMRHYVDDDDTPGLEIVARCDKSRMPARYMNNSRPWLQIEFGDYRIPPCGEGERWIGNQNINHTFAILQVINNNNVHFSYRDVLISVRERINWAKAEIERLEREEADSRIIANHHTFLAQYQRNEADLHQRVMLEETLRMRDDGCDVW